MNVEKRGGSNDVAERRLRPVYEHIDSGNNKKVIHEVDKLLKKQRENHCAKALKSLALLRLGKKDEANALLEELHGLKLSDEGTIQVMAMCYKEMGEFHLLAEMFQNAAVNHKENEHFLASLFMAYVRIGDFKKQQQTAMSLHRLCPAKNPYYFWGIMSIVMQAISDQKLAKTMFLPLAERMAEKYVADKKIEAEAEVQLYMMILEMSEKYENAIKVVQGEYADKLSTEFMGPDYKTAHYFCKMGQYGKANSLYQKLLKEHPDSWELYIGYIDTLFVQEDHTEDGHSSPSQAISFFDELIGTLAIPQRRAPMLAQMQLAKVMLDKHLELPMKLSMLVEEYCQEFCSKSSCFVDVQQYFELLCDEKEHVLSKLNEHIVLFNKDGKECLPLDVQEFHRQLTLCQLLFNSGKLFSAEHSDEMLVRYEAGLKIFTEQLSTDIHPADQYVLMAVKIMLNIADHHEPQVWRAFVYLDRALRTSPANYKLKLILMALYNNYGAMMPSLELYKSMDVKYIQNEGLGYLLSAMPLRCGLFTTGLNMAEQMIQYFHSAQREATEFLITAYKYGTFSKICELGELRTKLGNSIQGALGKAESIMLRLISQPDSHTVAEHLINCIVLGDIQLDVNSIVDNSDLTIWVSIDHKHEQFVDMLKASLTREQIDWIGIQRIIIHLCCSAVLLAQKPEEDTPEHLRQLIHRMNQRGHDVRLYILPDWPLLAPPRSILYEFIKADCDLAICATLRIVLGAYHLRRTQVDDVDIQSDVDAVIACLRSLFPEKAYHNGMGEEMTEEIIQICQCSRDLSSLSLGSYTTGVLCLMLGSSVKLLVNTKKTRKKDDQFFRSTKFMACLKKLVCEVMNILARADTFLEHQMELCTVCSFGALSFSEKEQAKILFDNIIKSHISSYLNIKSVLKAKHAYLAGLNVGN